MIKNFKDLLVWQQARTLTKQIYFLSQSFPKEETYGLSGQIRRAIISVISNIAEGHSRSSTKDYIQYISMAIGSLAEVETQLIIACDLQYLQEETIGDTFASIHDLQRKLHSLRKALRSKLNPTQIPSPKSLIPA